MYIRKLTEKNFRNIENLEVDLNKNVNIFIGDNAQGKTSILESIYVLSLTKSMRSNDDFDYMRKDAAFTLIKALVKVEHNTKKLEFFLDKEGKKLKLDEKRINRLTDYVSNLKVIIFSPDDLDIVKKSPSLRRNLLNIELCQLFPKYTVVLNEYNKLLKMRNDYLKKDYQAIDRNYLDILTEKLIERALVIMDYREKFLSNINLYLDTVYYRIMKEHGLHISYQMSFNSRDKEQLKKLFYDNFFQELNKKMTLFGPHRDDFSFYLHDLDVKNYGSQGQQRVAILVFKLSEIYLFKEVGGSPVVLLDDIFSEMDVNKRKNLLKFIKSDIQFVITTTDINNISEKILDKASVFVVKNGKVQNRGVKK